MFLELPEKVPINHSEEIPEPLKNLNCQMKIFPLPQAYSTGSCHQVRAPDGAMPLASHFEGRSKLDLQRKGMLHLLFVMWDQPGERRR